MKLRCVSRYASRNEVYRVGDVIDVEPAHAARLLADSPGSFEVIKEPAARSRQVRKPTNDRAMVEPQGDDR